MSYKIFYLFFSLFSLALNSEIKTPDLSGKNIAEMRQSIFHSHVANFYLLNEQIKQNYLIAGSTVLPIKSEKNNKLTDLILYKIESNSFDFYYQTYDSDKASFDSPVALFSIQKTSNYNFANLFVGSFIHTMYKNVSFLVSFFDKENNSYVHYITVYDFAKNSTSHESSKLEINSNIIVGDIDGDRDLEIIFNSPTGKQVLKFLDLSSNPISISVKPFNSYLSDDTENCPQNFMHSNSPLSSRGGHAFVDLNADCVSDLIISSETEGNLNLEIYIGIKENVDYSKNNYTNARIKYCLVQTIDLGKDTSDNLGAFALADLYHKGLLNLIVPIKENVTLKVYNNTVNMSGDWRDNFCEKHLSVDSNKTAIFDDSNVNYVQLDTHGLNNPKLYSNYPTVIRFGDYEGTGFPGLLTVLKDSNGRTYVYLYKTYSTDDRIKEKVTGLFELEYNFETNGKPELAAFFDVDEDGVLDVLIQDSQGNTSLFYNNIQSDKYFIKSKLMNNPTESMRNKDKITYFITDPGASFIFYVTNNDGNRDITISTQMSQTSDHSLALPYALTGIGRSNNYIENFVAVSNSFDQKRLNKISFEWRNGDVNLISPVIPNTQLMISKLTDEKDINWEIDLIVQPTDKLIILIIIVAVVLLVVLGFIIYLHNKEREEEKEEAKIFTNWFA